MLNRYFYPAIGGVENHIKNLSRELIKMGHEIVIICSNRNFKGEKIEKKHENIQGINIFRYNKFKEIHKLLKKLKVDIVHIHLYRSTHTPFLFREAKKAKLPIIHTPHCIYPPKSFVDLLKKKIYDFLFSSLIINSSSVIINLTKQDQMDMMKLGMKKEKSIIIPNSIIIPPETKKETNVFKKYKLAENYILYVGRIDWNKGIDKLIYVVKKVQELDSRCIELAIVGEDISEKKKLLKLIKKLNLEEKVKFLGFVPSNDLISLYKYATCFILLSAYEGLPTVVLEAMFHSTVTIATAEGGTKFVIENGVDGFLVDKEDINNIAEIIIKLVKNRQEGVEIGKRAKEKIINNYLWEKNSVKMKDIYYRIVRKNEL